MKRINIAIAALSVGLLLAGSSCNKLEEYNPSASTAEKVFTSVEGFEALINQCYSNYRTENYGREDILFFTETGVDIWHMAYDRRYGPHINKYEGVNADGNVKNKWDRYYIITNLCNGAIDRADAAGYTDENVKNAKVAEAHFLRAFTYWHIVETWGGVSLVTKETNSPITVAYRSPVSDFYKLIFDDLKFAIEWLPVKQVNTASGNNENGRATKGAAHGMLARMYLSYASYLKYWANDEGQAAEYYTLAKTTADEVITKKAEYGVELYADYADVFKPANNKNNKEALFVVSHSTNTGLNGQNQPNRLHQWFGPRYDSKIGMKVGVEYGRSGQAFLQPTRYLLELYDETKDARYAATFREVWLANNSEKLMWDTTQMKAFGKDTAAFKGKTLTMDDTALLYTKKAIVDKANRRYAVWDINDMFESDGRLTAKAKNGDNACFPALLKYDDPLTRPDANSDRGYNDIIIMRLAEMYLISAEASVELGNLAPAVVRINELRERTKINNVSNDITDADFATSPSGADPINWILDERARELCGEHLRWYDLKRTKQLENRLGPGKANPNITLFDKNKNYFRNIPLSFLRSLDNPTEFGQNPGY